MKLLEVVEKLLEGEDPDTFQVAVETGTLGTECTVWNDGFMRAEAHALTATRAICLAALRAKGVE